MEDVTLTQLFERMDAHLAQQDAYLRRQDVSREALLSTLREQHLMLADAAKLLAETRRQVEASARELRAAWAAEREAWAGMLREFRPRREEDR